MAPPTKPSISASASAFVMVKKERPPRRLIVSVMGAQKVGKNHFAFGAPGDTYFHSFDFGDEGVINKFAGIGGKNIYRAEYKVEVPAGTSVQQTADACTPVWNQFRTNYLLGLAKGRTTIVDTGTDAYELIRMSYFGKLGQVMPHHYAPVNAEFKELIRAGYSSGKNVIFLHRTKDEWSTKILNGKEVSNKTGEKIFAGYSGMPFEVQVHMRAFRDTEGFKMEILDCRQNPDLNGFILEGEMNNWATLGTMVYPDSKEEEWI